MIQLKEHFASDHRSHQSDWLLQQQWFIKSRHDQEKRDDKAEKLQDDLLSFAIDALVASEIQIEEFNMKLDQYDESTVKALMDNQIRIDEINAKIENMLADAYVMDDGRRVFKSYDNNLIIDEFGTIVTAEEIDPNLIPNGGIAPEQYLDALNIRNEELEIQTQLIEFQEQLDSARELSAKDGVTTQELDDLEADLFDALPPSVKSNISGFDTAENAPDVTAIFAKNASPVVTVITPSPSQISTYDPN
ncbi:MAG: hypothetical protein HRU28_07520 [Rhizobiales bacterium]|nr:hypothetical protein [Hyphomicrobiales bacterium]